MFVFSLLFAKIFPLFKALIILIALFVVFCSSSSAQLQQPPIIYENYINISNFSIPQPGTPLSYSSLQVIILRNSVVGRIDVAFPANPDAISTQASMLNNIHIIVQNCEVTESIVFGKILLLTDSVIEVRNNTVWGTLNKLGKVFGTGLSNQRDEGWKYWSQSLESTLLRSTISISNNSFIGIAKSSFAQYAASSSSSLSLHPAVLTSIPPLFDKQAGIDFRGIICTKHDGVLDISGNTIIGGFHPRWSNASSLEYARFSGPKAIFGVLLSQVYLLEVMGRSNGRILVRNNNVTLNSVGVTERLAVVDRVEGITVLATGDFALKNATESQSIGLNGDDNAGFFVENNYVAVMGRRWSDQRSRDPEDEPMTSTVRAAVLQLDGHFNNVNNLVVNGNHLQFLHYYPDSSLTAVFPRTFDSVGTAEIRFMWTHMGAVSTWSPNTYSNFKLIASNYNTFSSSHEFDDQVQQYINLNPFTRVPFIANDCYVARHYLDFPDEGVIIPVSHVERIELIGNEIRLPIPVLGDSSCVSMDFNVLFAVGSIAVNDNIARTQLAAITISAKFGCWISAEFGSVTIANNSLFISKLLGAPMHQVVGRGYDSAGQKTPSRIGVYSSNTVFVHSANEQSVMNQMTIKAFAPILQWGLTGIKGVLNVSSNFGTLGGWEVCRGISLANRLAEIATIVVANNNFAVLAFNTINGPSALAANAAYIGVALFHTVCDIKNQILIENNTVFISPGNYSPAVNDTAVLVAPFDDTSPRQPPSVSFIVAGIMTMQWKSAVNIPAIVIRRNNITITGFYTSTVVQELVGIVRTVMSPSSSMSVMDPVTGRPTQPNETNIGEIRIEENEINVTAFGCVGSDSFGGIKYHPGLPSDVTSLIIRRNKVIVKLEDFDFDNSPFFQVSGGLYGKYVTPQPSTINTGAASLITINAVRAMDGTGNFTMDFDLADFSLDMRIPPNARIVGFKNFIVSENHVELTSAKVALVEIIVNGQYGEPYSPASCPPSSSASSSSSTMIPFRSVITIANNTIRLTAISHQAARMSMSGPLPHRPETTKFDFTRRWSAPFLRVAAGGVVRSPFKRQQSGAEFIALINMMAMSQNTRLQQVDIVGNDLVCVSTSHSGGAQARDAVFGPLVLFQSNVTLLRGILIRGNRLNLSSAEIATGIFPFLENRHKDSTSSRSWTALGENVGILLASSSSFSNRGQEDSIAVADNQFLFSGAGSVDRVSTYLPWVIRRMETESELLPASCLAKLDPVLLTFAVRNNSFVDVPQELALGGFVVVDDGRSSASSPSSLQLPSFASLIVSDVSITTAFSSFAQESSNLKRVLVATSPSAVLTSIEVTRNSLNFTSSTAPTFNVIDPYIPQSTSSSSRSFVVSDCNFSGIDALTSRVVASPSSSSSLPSSPQPSPQFGGSSNMPRLSAHCLRVNDREVRRSNLFVAASAATAALVNFSLCDAQTATPSMSRTVSQVPSCAAFNLRYVGPPLHVLDVRGNTLRLLLALVLASDDETLGAASYAPSPQRKVPVTDAPEGERQSAAATVLRLHLRVAGASNTSFANDAAIPRLGTSTPALVTPLFGEVTDWRSLRVTVKFSGDIGDDQQRTIQLHLPAHQLVMCRNETNLLASGLVSITLFPTFSSTISASARQAMESAVTGLALASAVAGDPSALAEANIVLALDAFKTCSFSDTKPQPSSMSPLLLGFGSELGRYHRGTVLGNLVITAVFVLALCCLAKYLQQKDCNKQKNKNGTNGAPPPPPLRMKSEAAHPRFKNYLFRVLLPGILLLTLYGLVHGTVSSATALLRVSKNPNDYFLASLGLGTTIAFMMWIAYVIFVELKQAEKFFWYFENLSDGDVEGDEPTSTRKSFFDFFDVNKANNVVSSKFHQKLMRMRALTNQKRSQIDQRNKSAARLFPRCPECNLALSVASSTTMKKRGENLKSPHHRQQQQQYNRYFSAETQQVLLRSHHLSSANEEEEFGEGAADEENASVALRTVKKREMALLGRAQRFVSWITTPYGEWELLRTPAVRRRGKNKSTKTVRTDQRKHPPVRSSPPGALPHGKLSPEQRRFPDKTHYLLDKATFRGRHLTLVLVVVAFTIAALSGIAPPPDQSSSAAAAACAHVGAVVSLLAMVPLVYYLWRDPFRKKLARLFAFGTALGIFVMGFFLIISKIAHPKFVVDYVAPTIESTKFCIQGWIAIKSSIDAIAFVQLLVNAEFGRTSFWVIRHYILHRPGDLLNRGEGDDDDDDDDDENGGRADDSHHQRNKRKRNSRTRSVNDFCEPHEQEELMSFELGSSRGEVEVLGVTPTSARSSSRKSHCWTCDQL